MGTLAVTLGRRPQPDVSGVRIPPGTMLLLRDLIHLRTGMFYDHDRLDSLSDRIVPLAQARGFDSLLDYYYLLKYDADADAEWARAIDALSVQETYFWREADQLHALTEVMLPELLRRGRRPIRIWSIPCATGEEPLSIVMALTERGWFTRAEVEVHAADASEAALRRARAGVYGARSFRQLPLALRDRYFIEDGNQWRVVPALHQRVVSWSCINAVNNSELSSLRGADVIFCRNLFIYFQEAHVRQVVEMFAELLNPPGYLCVGAAESLLRVTRRFELEDLAGAYVYRLAAA
jgi:chemotaxis protein methyltransferase CheR